MFQSQKERIKELRAWAKDNLIGKEVEHPEFPEKIGFTNTGIKEFLNQPHCNYHAKNESLIFIIDLIQASKVVHEAPDIKGNTNHHFYYLESIIENLSSFIVIRHTMKDNKYTLYSMVDKLKKPVKPTTKDMQSNTESLPV